jgi:hypothetical protein
MTARWKEVLIVGLLAALGVGFRMWLEGHDQALLAKAQISEQQAIIQQKDQDLQQAAIDRDKILADEHQHLQAIEAVKERVLQSSPQDQLDALSQAIQQPLEMQKNPDTGKQDAVLPDAPEALPKVLEFAYNCQECSTSLQARTAEIADLNGEIKTLTEKGVALESQRDAALKMHGTGFWTRAKWFAIGAGGGAVAYVIVHH